MTGFYCFALYFFHSYEKHNCFFRFWWLSVISQRDVVYHWHGYIHYTSYLRKSVSFCSTCCKTTCCKCMALEDHTEVCDLRWMSWSFSNFGLLMLRCNIIVFEWDTGFLLESFWESLLPFWWCYDFESFRFSFSTGCEM